MQDEIRTITLMVPAEEEVEGGREIARFEDRGGGEVQSEAVKDLIRRVFPRPVPVELDKVKAGLEKSLKDVRGLMADLQRQSAEADGWDLKGISVSFAIDAHGTVGFATAGIQASIQIEFSPRPHPYLPAA